MVEFIKEIVSGKKRRYRQDGLNLDLTYVTDRIVAMSYPSTGFESMYRNDIDDVARLFGSKHGSKYLVINLSERKYNYEKFNNQVVEFAWEDHHSPPLDVLFQACQLMDEFLNRDPENVIVVHCLAGKGRTGTIIACYFLYCGRFEQVKHALKYYKIKRFERGGGVTQPSQVRYVQYFGYVLHGFLHEQKLFYPTVVKIDRMVLYGIPRISVGYFKPYVELYSVKKRALIYSTKRPEKPVPKFITRDDETHQEKVVIPFPDSIPVSGDILVRVYHMSTLGPKLVFRFGFNTTFLIKGQDNQAILPLSIEELDPDSTKADDRFPPKFYTEVYMDIIPTMTQESAVTNTSALEARKEDHELWDEIYKILNNYKQPPKEHANILLFKNPERDDIEKILYGPANNARKNVSLNPSSGIGNNRGPQEDLNRAEVLDPEESEVDRKQGKEVM